MVAKESGCSDMLLKFSLKDRVAIITGGASGIGKGIALGFADVGAKVVIVDINKDNANSAVKEITNSGGEAFPVMCDVLDPEQVQKMVDQAISKYGKIDILVNNTGGSRGAKRAPLIETEDAVWDLIIDLNLKSTFLCSKIVGKVMVKQKSGNIINIVSGAGLRPYPGQLAYGTAKAGIVNFTQGAAVQLAQYHIRVNAIAPGITATPGAKYLGNPQERAVQLKGIVMERAGRVEDLALAAIFLASDASDYITGHTIPVMGGPHGGLFMLKEAQADWSKQ